MTDVDELVRKAKAERRSRRALYGCVALCLAGVIGLGVTLAVQEVHDAQTQTKEAKRKAEVDAAIAALQGQALDRANTRLKDNNLPQVEVPEVREGPQGIQGVKGLQGEPGRDGRNGADGKSIKGEPGKDGVNGTNGINGADGKDGANGKDGQDGAPGAPGQSAYPFTWTWTVTDGLNQQHTYTVTCQEPGTPCISQEQP